VYQSSKRSSLFELRPQLSIIETDSSNEPQKIFGKKNRADLPSPRVQQRGWGRGEEVLLDPAGGAAAEGGGDKERLW